MAEARSGRVFIMTEDQMQQMINAIRLAVREEMTRNMNKIEHLGDVCTKEEASKVLRVTRATIYAMIEDGRLQATADGRRVVVSSIRDYLNMREQSGGKTDRKVKKSYV